MKKRVIAIIIAVVVIGVGAFFVYNRVLNSSPTPPEPSTENTVDTPTPTPEVNNSETAGEVGASTDMQTVIDSHQGDLYQGEMGDTTNSYPRNLVPLYKVAEMGSAHDIVGDNGSPGWIATYGSEATTDELIAFYQALMGSTENYSLANESETAHITGTVSGCNVSINISPNNPQQSGLNYQSDVNIYIVRNM